MATSKHTQQSESHKCGYYLLDTHILNECKGSKSHEQFAKIIGVHKNSAKRLTDTTHSQYVSVQEDTAKGISNGLHKPLADLIYRRPLPNTSQFYEELAFGWFIDNTQGSDQDEPKRPQWFSESITLYYDADNTKKNQRLSFKGEIKNCYETRFRVRAERLSDYIFCMLSDSDDQKLSFVGIANHHVLYSERNINVMLGTWSGIDVGGYTAVFRWMLTNHKLSKEDITQLSKHFSIEAYFNAVQFHSEFGRYAQASTPPAAHP
jgi:hypothetical protein